MPPKAAGAIAAANKGVSFKTGPFPNKTAPFPNKVAPAKAPPNKTAPFPNKVAPAKAPPNKTAPVSSQVADDDEDVFAEGGDDNDEGSDEGSDNTGGGAPRGTAAATTLAPATLSDGHRRAFDRGTKVVRDKRTNEGIRKTPWDPVEIPVNRRDYVGMGLEAWVATQRLIKGPSSSLCDGIPPRTSWPGAQRVEVMKTLKKGEFRMENICCDGKCVDVVTPDVWQKGTHLWWLPSSDEYVPVRNFAYPKQSPCLCPDYRSRFDSVCAPSAPGSQGHGIYLQNPCVAQCLGYDPKGLQPLATCALTPTHKPTPPPLPPLQFTRDGRAIARPG